MPHQINMKSTWPWILEPTCAQASQGLSAPRNEFEPGTHLPGHGGPDGTFEVRTLRELCHDLTMPATSIRLLASVAAKESDPDPALKIRLRQIADEAGRIADICSSFLDPARKPGPTDLRLVAVDAADSARSRFSGAIDVVADPVTAAAHPVDVARILANLLDNACRAAGPAGRVRLAVEREGCRARLVVADSGRGFGNGEFGHASLGLGIVAALVRRNDGAVQMGTGDLGGLAVTVTLPEGGRPVASDGPGAFAAQRTAAGRGTR
jgi:signal transduction histidine kinase